MTKQSKKLYALAAFSLLLSLWSLTLLSNHNLLFSAFSVAGAVGAISMFFHAKIGGALVLVFYLPQTVRLYTETWYYIFSPGLHFSITLRSGDLFNPGPGFAINLLALVMLVVTYFVCFKESSKN